jgi:hypothetical protein
MDGVKADLVSTWRLFCFSALTRHSKDHYASYGKPIWVTEFACVDDVNGFVPCTDQGEINSFINDIVDLFESDSRVAAYAYR